MPASIRFYAQFAHLAPGTRLAVRAGMASRRAHAAAIAAASDGSVLINVVELLPDDMRSRLSKHLGALDVFVGVPLNEKDAFQVVTRLDGAAAEVSAQLLGGRAKKKAAAAKRR
jgi:hypothetical protein